MFLAGFEPEILESDVSDLLLVPLCRIDISLVSVSYSANIKRNGSVCILGKLSTGSHEGLTIFKEVILFSVNEIHELEKLLAWEECVIDVARTKGKTLADTKRLALDRIAFRQWTEDPTLQDSMDRRRRIRNTFASLVLICARDFYLRWTNVDLNDECKMLKNK